MKDRNKDVVLTLERLWNFSAQPQEVKKQIIEDIKKTVGDLLWPCFLTAKTKLLWKI